MIHYIDSVDDVFVFLTYDVGGLPKNEGGG